MEKKIKHLEMLQAVINRMAGNSFLVKGWCVTLVAALFALGSGSGNLGFVGLAYFPALMFWILDAYFLWQERLFRQLYDKVRLMDEESVDFSMETRSILNITESWQQAIVSKTLLIFYGTIVGSILITLVFVQ